jgi:hypothetical protein
MQLWFLSYNSQDVRLAQQLETALRRRDSDAKVFFAPKSLRAGGYWLPELAKQVADATAFVLLVAQNKLGPWQVMEYYEALDRRVKEPTFPLVLVLLQDQPAPGLPFLRQLHWVVTPEPSSEETLGRLIDATAGGGSRPGELWRHTAPYRGLVAMTESDSDFFFGRDHETVEVVKKLAEAGDKLPILLGNSGVGKSSVAQAGVLAALARQNWSEAATDAGPWPSRFKDSRRWCFLKLSPGTEPLRSLVETLIDVWQLPAVDPERVKLQNGWIDVLRTSNATLRDLLDATERRLTELNQPRPPAFFLYIDQGEELYVRADECQQRRFSELVAKELVNPRLFAMMSLRADFFGKLQNDEQLYSVHSQINVPPLREPALREVVNRPPSLLSARFETDQLGDEIARRAAEDSVRGAGALPLLSYLLDDMWSQMVDRGDGVLRLPAQAIELGGVLVNRANDFLSDHPNSEASLRRIFTLNLATVREDGEPTRRRASRAEFSDDDWRLVSELADHPNRLLVIITTEAGETHVQVAHEAIFRRWEKLREWIESEREFLLWRSGLEAARSAWNAASNNLKDDALLMGLALSQAQRWLLERPQDLQASDRDFIEQSIERESLQQSKTRALRNQALSMQSRFLADLARQCQSRGDYRTAIALALEALPDEKRGIARPYVAAAELSLYRGIIALQDNLLRRASISGSYASHSEGIRTGSIASRFLTMAG